MQIMLYRVVLVRQVASFTYTAVEVVVTQSLPLVPPLRASSFLTAFTVRIKRVHFIEYLPSFVAIFIR